MGGLELEWGGIGCGLGSRGCLRSFMSFGSRDGMVGDLNQIVWMGLLLLWFAGGGDNEGEDLMAMEWYM